MQCDQCGRRIDRSKSRVTHLGGNYCEKCRGELDMELRSQALVVGSPTQIADAIEHYHVEITACWRNSVLAIIATGRALAKAKDSLPHGQWIPFVEQRLPFSRRTAQRLIQLSESQNFDEKIMSIASQKCPVGTILAADEKNNIPDSSDADNCLPANARQMRPTGSHLEILPASWRTLYDLSVIPQDDFINLASDGVIRPEMQRADIKAGLAARRSPAPPEAANMVRFDGKYGAILADPPWQFKGRGSGPTDRSTEVHYPTMPLDELAALPVANLAADDCVLFLWVTSDHLMKAGEIMKYWGFEYKTTAFIWYKVGPIGLGYWTRKQAEICLLGTRGKPCRLARDVPEVIEAYRNKHSEKPTEVFRRIEKLVPGPYVELFARRSRDGWDAWGNDPNLKEGYNG